MPAATLKLVAKHAGVAPATASRVLNGAENVAPTTRDRVLAAVSELGYKPNIHAANLRRKTPTHEPTPDVETRSACSNESTELRPDSSTRAPFPPEGPFAFTPDESRALARHIALLRRELERLKRHTDRLQTSVDRMHEVYSK